VKFFVGGGKGADHVFDWGRESRGILASLGKKEGEERRKKIQKKGCATNQSTAPRKKEKMAQVIVWKKSA